jgi:hypothetical protein
VILISFGEFMSVIWPIKEILESEVQNCRIEIERNVLRFTNESNFLLFTEDLTGI